MGPDNRLEYYLIVLVAAVCSYPPTVVMNGRGADVCSHIHVSHDDLVAASIINNDNVNAQQRERAEKNRQKALALKRAKLVPRQNITKDTRECFLTGESLESQSQSSHFTEKKTIDTGAGFFIEEEEDDKTER